MFLRRRKIHAARPEREKALARVFLCRGCGPRKSVDLGLDAEESHEGCAPIDHFFETLANTHGHHSIGVILSGTGADGSFGLRKIKEQGGLTIAQEPEEPQFDSMPHNAIVTGQFDLVLPVVDMPWHMRRFASTKPCVEIAEAPEESVPADRETLRNILSQVQARANMDFSKYKQSRVLRRIRRRMQLHQTEPLAGATCPRRGDGNPQQVVLSRQDRGPGRLARHSPERAAQDSRRKAKRRKLTTGAAASVTRAWPFVD
jgi:CheB methylesterase/CheR methyltransferase, all-alpha domain